jgi:hypothetical protein
MIFAVAGSSLRCNKGNITGFYIVSSAEIGSKGIPPGLIAYKNSTGFFIHQPEMNILFLKIDAGND